jgi:hypothetical protein
VIENLLDSLPSLYEGSRVAESVIGAAAQAAYLAMVFICFLGFAFSSVLLMTFKPRNPLADVYLFSKHVFPLLDPEL